MILRSLFFIFCYVPFLIVFVPLQYLISRSPWFNNQIPRWFHWFGATFLGMKVKVIEFRNEEIEAIQEVIAKRLGYRLVDHRLELYAVPLKSEDK